MNIESVAIIGAGPAGLATALQLKRYGLTALLLERDQVGGLLRNACRVENYPGFPAGIRGADLVRLFAQQAKTASVEVTFEEVTELAHTDGYFRVTTGNHAYRSRTVVIASGTKPKTLAELPIPESVQDRVLYETYPIAQITGKRIAIIGAGDAAFDYALSLCRNNHVVILNRGDNTRCLPLLRERAAASARIAYRAGTRLLEVAEAPERRMLLKCSGPDGASRLHADFLVGAIGREPRLEFVAKPLSENVRDLEGRGLLYCVGDVKNGSFRQTAIAVGDGILAAMRIYQSTQETSR